MKATEELAATTRLIIIIHAPIGYGKKKKKKYKHKTIYFFFYY